MYTVIFNSLSMNSEFLNNLLNYTPTELHISMDIRLSPTEAEKLSFNSVILDRMLMFYLRIEVRCRKNSIISVQKE